MSFFGVSREDLTPLLPNEYSNSAGISSKAGKLSMALVRIKAVVEDAEKKQSTDHSVKEWLQLLKDAEYAVEDILAEVSINSNQLQDTSTFDPKNNIIHHNMVERLNEIGSRFNELEERRNKLLPQEDVIAEDMSVEVAGQTSLIQRRHRRDGSEIEPINQIAEIVSTNRRSNHLSQATWQNLFNADNIWRLVGLVSTVVGLSCYALSPSFNRLIATRKPFKLIAYGVLSLALCTFILFANKSPSSTRHDQLKIYTSFAVLMILSMYTFFYDRAVNGKPDILNVVSNAAFVLVSLSLHKLFNFGFEIGVFSYFLGCFANQLFTINRILILIAIFIGYPLFSMHSSLNSQPEVASGGQVSHSSSNSRLVVGSDDQHVIDNIDS